MLALVTLCVGILLWLSLEDKIKFLHDVKDLKMNELIVKLKETNIPFTLNSLASNDILHIPPGMFHYVECNTSNDYTIILNVDYANEDAELGRQWDELWPPVW